MQPIRYTLSYYLALIDNAEDQNKFEYLYNHYQKQMYYTAKRILNDAFIAEDAVHEAFVKIARNMNKIDDMESNETRSFVMIVTKRAAIDVYRKRNQYFDREVYETITDDGEISNIIEECAATVDIPEFSDFHGSEVGKALLTLSHDAHDVILLRYVLGYDNREISEITGFSVSKIEKLLSRGKKKLVEKLSANRR